MGPSLTYSEAKHDVFRLDPGTGVVVDTVEVPIPVALAVGPDGSLYVFDEGALNFGSAEDLSANHISRVLKFSSSGDLLEVVAANAEVASSKTNSNLNRPRNRLDLLQRRLRPLPE